MRKIYKEITLTFGKRASVYILPLLSLAALISCTKAPIHDRVDQQGEVSIVPNQDRYQLPALVYHFYDIGGDREYIQQNSDMSGNFFGKLPVGDYQALAANTSVNKVVFNNMSNYNKATAAVTPLVLSGAPFISSLDNDSFSFYEQPGMLYSVVPETFTVTVSDHVYLTPNPKSLTHRLILRFMIDQSILSQMTGLRGIVHGIFSSVNLFKGKTEETNLNKIFTAAVPFEAQSVTGGFLSLITHFGILDPKYGDVYTNTLTMEMDMKDGSKDVFEVDLTTILTDAIIVNGGVLPLELFININVNRGEIGVIAEVITWEHSGDTELEIPY